MRYGIANQRQAVSLEGTNMDSFFRAVPGCRSAGDENCENVAPLLEIDLFLIGFLIMKQPKCVTDGLKPASLCVSTFSFSQHVRSSPVVSLYTNDG